VHTPYIAIVGDEQRPLSLLNQGSKRDHEVVFVCDESGTY